MRKEYCIYLNRGLRLNHRAEMTDLDQPATNTFITASTEVPQVLVQIIIGVGQPSPPERTLRKKKFRRPLAG